MLQIPVQLRRKPGTSTFYIITTHIKKKKFNHYGTHIDNPQSLDLLVFDSNVPIVQRQHSTSKGYGVV